MPFPPSNFEVVASDNVLPIPIDVNPLLVPVSVTPAYAECSYEHRKVWLCQLALLCCDYLTVVLEMFYNSTLCQTKSFVMRLIGSIMDCFGEMVKEVRRKAGWNSVKHELS